MTRLFAGLTSVGVAVAMIAACGARSSLRIGDEGAGGTRGVGGQGGEGGEPPPPEPCDGVEERPCGSSEGLCLPGVQRCQEDGFFGPCEGAEGPFEELCNDLDDNCDGVVDDGFDLGAPCDGPDNDECADDVITCDGCSDGPDILEVCNGVDDNCNGLIDSDCDVGSCMPGLLVTGSVPSSPNCIDFPVEAGSTGTITYPCEGGPVTATLGQVTFSGSVTADGIVSLFGSVDFVGPDGCDWRADHYIDGSIPGGTVSYFYDEILLTTPQGNCWFPCTETGTVDIEWEM